MFLCLMLWDIVNTHVAAENPKLVGLAAHVVVGELQSSYGPVSIVKQSSPSVVSARTMALMRLD